MHWVKQGILKGIGLLSCAVAIAAQAYEPAYVQALAGYDQMLKKVVHDGRVDYVQVTSAAALPDYLSALAGAPGSLSVNEKKALYINAYNAFTLQLIVDYWPDIESIKDIPDNFFSGYRRWQDTRWVLAGERVSLSQLEHEMLRPMGDARIHFAIVCASISCPDLQAFAYQAKTLDVQLDNVAKAFLADSSKGLKLDREARRLSLSKIFTWFEDDFERDAGTVYAYLIRYADAPTAQALTLHKGTLDLEDLAYDWNLNKRLP